MLHTKMHKSRMAIMVKQLMLVGAECIFCYAYVSVIQKLAEETAERILATTGQENTIKHNRRINEQFYFRLQQKADFANIK